MRAVKCYLSGVDFESADEGWQFWRYARDPLLRVADTATDFFVFQGKNDLVVDLTSMIDASGGEAYVFDDADRVHHTSYFRQARTVDKIRAWLAIP